MKCTGVNMNDQLYSFSTPKQNVKMTFGSGTNMYFQFYCENKPNKFQRWMMKTLLGIVMVDI